MNKSLTRILQFSYTIIALFYTSHVSAQTNITSAASGDWSNVATWVGGVVPTANDSVSIAGTHAVNITANASCAAVTVLGGATGTTLNINSGVTLTVSRNATINRATANDITNTINVGAGTLTAAALDLKGNTANLTRITRLSISTGTVNLIGNTTAAIDGSVFAIGAPSEVVFTGNGTLNLTKNFMSGTNGGTLVAGTGTIANNSSLTMIFGGYTYNNITIAGTGGLQFIGNSILNGTFNNTANNLNAKIRGNLTSNGTFNAGTGSYTFESTSPNTNPATALTLTGNFSISKVEIDTNVTLTLPANSTLTNTGSFTNFGAFVNNGTLTKTQGQYRGNGGTFGGKPFVNTASIVAGDTLGCLTFSSGFDNGSGVLDMDISGATACTQHDQIAVTGTANADGALRIDFGNFVPTIAQKFTIITGATTHTGSFDSIVVTPRRIAVTYASGVLTVSGITSTQNVDLDPNGLIVKNTLATDMLTLETPLYKTSDISLFNTSGRQVLNIKMQGLQNIPIRHLPNGLYVVRSQEGHVRKFVKQ